MSEKTKYILVRIEITHIPQSDLITTSTLSSDDEPTHDQDGWA